MMVNKTDLFRDLKTLGLDGDEAKVFLALLEKPLTHLELSKATNINRSTMYRLVDALNSKGLVHEVTTDEGKLIESARPDALQQLIVNHEILLDKQRRSFSAIMGALPALSGNDEDGFSIKTYHGVAGLKQMLWNELRTKREVVIFSHINSLNAVAGKPFAEKFRAEIISRGIKQRSINNSANNSAEITYTDLEDYTKTNYDERVIPTEKITIAQEVSIHDDTVSIYNWDNDLRVGTEIKNALYANFMRQIFEYFWELAG